MKNVILFLLLIGFTAVSATSWRVNNNPAIDADFATFEAAVAAASAGDTLYMEGSNFTYGAGVLTKALLFFGRGFFLT